MKSIQIPYFSTAVFTLIFLLFFSIWLEAQKEEIQHLSLSKERISSKPLHEIASLGASTTGPLVEGSIGAIHRGCRHRFYSRSSGPITGFLGAQENTGPIILKDQPGVFPAPILGAASITFDFHYQDGQGLIIPVIIRPDGTIYEGLAMSAEDSPQTLFVASPAQTGIYTLFVIPYHHNSLNTHVTVNASVSTQLENSTTFNLKPFDINETKPELISAEFIYTRSPGK